MTAPVPVPASYPGTLKVFPDAEVETKQCTKCLGTWPATGEFFYTTYDYKGSRQVNSRLMPECKTCNQARQKKIRDRSKKTPEPAPATKRCSRCEKEFPRTLEFFHKLNTYYKSEITSVSLRAECKSCAIERSRAAKGTVKKIGFESVTHKTCNLCGIDKPVSKFYPTKKRHTDGIMRQYGWMARCKECIKNKSRMHHASKNKELRADPDKVRQQLVDQYGNYCRICGVAGGSSSDTRLAIDHNHLTGATRGLLCRAHNLLLGLANDSIETLMTAVSYLMEAE